MAKLKPNTPRKKLGGAKAKPKAKKAVATNWFHRMTKRAQVAYIKAHPNSIYAKKGAKPASKKAASTPAVDSPEVSKINAEIERLKAKIADARYTKKMSSKRSSPADGRNGDLASRTISEGKDKIKALVAKRAAQRKLDRKKK